MKRLLVIFWAHVRCNFYLLFKGMWKGQCSLMFFDGGRVIFIGCGTGSLADMTLKVNKTFYSTKSNDYFEVSRNV